MLRRLLAAALLVCTLPASLIAGTYSGAPDASVPLGTLTDEMPIDQGAGCPTNTATCTTSRVSSLRVGQPIIAAVAPSSPFNYQQWIDTSTPTPTLRQFIGATWFPIATLSSISGFALSGATPLAVASGGTGGTVASGTLLDNITGFAGTGLLNRTGAGTYGFKTAPAGAVVGDTDAQTLTNKVINCANNTCTVRAASDITGVLAVANGGTGDTGTVWINNTWATTCDAGAFANATAATWHKTLGKTVFINVQVQITTVGGACTGAAYIIVPLPVQATANHNAILAGSTSTTNLAITGSIAPSATTILIRRYDGTYPAVNGTLYILTGVYESP